MNVTRKGYDFDDLLMIPRFTRMDSREEVDISTDLGKGLKLGLPIIGSPMVGIMSESLCKELDNRGSIGVLHRFVKDWQLPILEQSPMLGIAVGLGEYEKAFYAIDKQVAILCIDVANGYLNAVLEMTEELSKYIENSNSITSLMAGNIADEDGFIDLANAGATLIRVGIGPGHLCTTRNKTGVGVPQLTAVDDCVQASDKYFSGMVKVIADGGIRNSGDLAKVLALGAHAGMIGSLLGKTYEFS